ncbi:MAG TPA: TIGR00266 family protein [Anaerolineaceae bacterium]|nr:TIGR00266 family protein [Anaerolineaceae bacterium]HNS36796.1 TIGR00266 family protein [Anaerolineaceae bacterium]HNZ12935.1 TIGR00266 family protein [Anaerolineaceae bacterium]HOD04129.1 TIGR00266 family protein [Anaerolineaceae bacterium]HOG79423.1 TIGR00266 family protein [Anaerolineaceae bacterium]
MQIEILYRPSYSVAQVRLNTGEAILAEPGAMVGMSRGIQVETRMRGGLMQSLARAALGGESFFTNTYRAAAAGDEILLAPTLPGDVTVLNLQNQEFLVQSGSFVASAETVTTDTKWTGARTFFGGEGLIMLRCSGAGELILSSYGAIHSIDLAAGQTYTIDTGHLVAFERAMKYEIRTLGGIKSTLLSGEGLVVDLTGPGRVLLQTRNKRAFLDWLIPQLPNKSNS